MRIASDSEANPGHRVRSAAALVGFAVLLCGSSALSRERAEANIPTGTDVSVPDAAGIHAVPQFAPVAAGFRAVGPSWFHRHGIELLQGRDFDEGDHVGAPGVVIVNEALAYRLWPGEAAIGKYMFVGLDSPVLRRVVGVVTNSRPMGCDGKPEAEIYVPASQAPALPMRLLA
jgi:hypothetical protein